MNTKEHNFGLHNRRLYLDIVKGIAILLMLWGHCIQYCANGDFDFFENAVFKFIYSFHMPLFMLVSGYLFAFSCRKRSTRELMINKIQSLLQPIIMCNIFNFIITKVIINRHFFSILDGNWLSQLGSLWFLWSVLSASIIVGVAYKIPKNTIMRLLIATFGFAFVCLFPNMHMNVYMYPYFLLGFLFAFVRQKLPKFVLKIKYLSILIFPTMLLFFKKEDYIYVTGIRNKSIDIISMIRIDLYRWIIGFVGSIFALVLVEFLFLIMHKFKAINHISIAISLLGKKSLQIYCISISMLSYLLPIVYSYICNKVGYNIFLKNLIFYNFFFTPILAICYAIALLLFVRLFEKLRINKILFGR